MLEGVVQSRALALVATPDPQRPPSSPSEPAPRALTTPFLDFWLLGGASLVVWLAMFVLQHFRSAWAVDAQFKNLSITTVSLALVVNNPHFLVSYKLAYARGRSFVTSHPWQLVIVPALLLGLFAFAFTSYDRSTAETFPFLPPLADALRARGVATGLFTLPRTGDFLFGLAFNFMYLTVGWHYTKQTFGCMMLCAAYDGYPLTPAQRRLVKWSLLSVWWVNFTYGNRHESRLTFSDFSYYSLDLPDVLAPIAAGLLLVGLALVLHRVVWANYRATGRLPSRNLLVPFVAIYVWWLPFTQQPEFYMLLTPLFHSLQYLAVVGKLESAQLRGARHREWRITALVLGVVAAGWLAFDFVPSTLDARLGTFGAWHMFFFFTAAMLFINIHHYFIDNAVWRFKDPVVKRYLLS